VFLGAIRVTALAVVQSLAHLGAERSELAYEGLDPDLVLEVHAESVSACARSFVLWRFWLITIEGPWSATKIASRRL